MISGGIQAPTGAEPPPLEREKNFSSPLDKFLNTPLKVAPSSTGVDSSWDCSCVLTLIVSCKVFKIQPIRVAHQKREGLSNFEKSVFDFSVLYLKKSGLSKKLKVSTLDIRIKQLGLKVFHFKVPSFCKLFSQFAIFWCNSSNVSLLKITLKESIDYQEEVPVYTYLPGTLEKTILYLDPIH